MCTDQLQCVLCTGLFSGCNSGCILVSLVFAIHNLLCKVALTFVCSLLTTVTIMYAELFCKE